MVETQFFQVFGWMARSLKLSGTELCVYAIVFSFSKDGETEYKGSTRYIMETLNVSKPTAMSALNSLVNKGLLIKRVENISGVTFNRYMADLNRLKDILPGVKNLDQRGKESLPGGGKEILPSNIYMGSIDENNKRDIYTSLRSVSISGEDGTKKSNRPYKEIIEYLNSKAGTSYRASSQKTQSMINARFNDGFTLEDFKKVIDTKVSMWKGTNYEQYIRPETLFGTKFEGYLNQKPKATDSYSNPNLYRDDSNVDPEEMWNV